MRFRLGATSSGPGTKGFWGSAEEAATFSQKMFKTFPGEGPYTITSTEVSNSFMRSAQYANEPGIGQTIYVRPPPGPVKVFNFSPNANLKFKF